MLHRSLLAVAIAAVLLLSACTYTVQPESGAVPAAPIGPAGTQAETQPSAQAAFILPDGNLCLNAGAGATLAFDGKRVNYTCNTAPEGKIVAIVDDPVQTTETEWQVEVATISHNDSGFVLDSSEVLEFTAWTVELSSGARCLHAGFGATIAFDGERANYTCDQIAADAVGPANGGDWVILGQLTNAGEGVWLANRAEIAYDGERFNLLENVQVEVSSISGYDLNAAATEEAPASVLAGTSWQWIQTQYGDGAVTEVADPSRYTLTFNADGTISAQLDCNHGAGGFTEDGPMLSFGPIASTMMLCPDDSQVTEFAQNLDIVVSYVLQDGNLYLAMFADTGIMAFTPLAEEAEAADAPALAGTSWQWIKTVYGDETTIDVADPSRYTLTFNADGTISAQLDCNRGAGGFIQDGPLLAIGPVATTLMACPDDSQAFEFGRDLESVVSFVLQDGNLHLALFADSGIITLAPLAEEEDMATLAGTAWQWVKTEYGDDSVIEVADPSRYTLTFNADGTLTAQLDCNRGMGSFTQDGPMLSFGPIASTRMACPSDSQDFEFGRDLEAVVSYVLQDGNLYLALFADAGIMTFAPVE